MHQIRSFIEWLSFHPTHNEIARALVTEYLSKFAVLGIRFGRINSDDSIVVLGQFGYPDADIYQNRAIPSTEWRSINAPDIELIKSGCTNDWTPESTFYVSGIRDHGTIHGYLIAQFQQPIEDSRKAGIAETIDDLCVPIALYLSFQNRTTQSDPGVMSVDSLRDAGFGQLTQRQILILRGMVEGKTNHELSLELGFSVSTIRHETMRIYQALAVSDRKEAAKKALTLSLV